MTLTDTGPLVALLDKRQHLHLNCRDVLVKASLPLITTWPCFTEAMYFAQRQGGRQFQERLWALIEDGLLLISHMEFTADTERASNYFDRIRELMRQYSDFPMDLADASLVATAERRRLHQIFTLDKRDFSIYRMRDGSTFEIIPD